MPEDQDSYQIEADGETRINVSEKDSGSTNPLFRPDQDNPDAAQKIARQQLMEAVRRDGFQAESLEEAWGKIVSVQVEIALDPEMGSKATTAAKFLAQVVGLRHSPASESSRHPTEIGSEAAQLLLELIAEERQHRAENA
ncbi:MAG: hypothetical protein IH859_04170 [Chloroflexi bacterium]|nr:hypothetical protein [Chloroflexota bacterium]